MLTQLTREQALKAVKEASAPYEKRYLAMVGDADVEVRRLTNLLVAGADKRAVRVRLQALGPERWPHALVDWYEQAHRAEDRHSCVYEALFHARDSAVARELGLTALNDRAYSVRWRAHQLLAYSLDRSVLPKLKDALTSEARPELRDSLKAAITAIEAQNHNLYKDRQGRGNVRWVVMPWEGTDPVVNHSRLKSRIRETVAAWQTEI